MGFEIFEIAEKKEKELWKNAVIVFDSSALLDFYYIPKHTRGKIFDSLFETELKKRLWIPSHVQFEYMKNREKTIQKPIIENYKPLKDEHIKIIIDSISLIENKCNDLKDKTRKDDKHPYLEQSEIDKYTNKISAFRKDTEEFKCAITKQIEAKEKEISDLHLNDDVYAAINKSFIVGKEFPFEKIIDITKEGKHRYEFLIPPGYKDLKDKKGTQIFGDLIIWKQILEFSKEKRKPILFICNDLKEDWCYIEEKEKRILSPREELIKEIFDYSKVDFWMYNLSQFIYFSNKYIAKTLLKEEIESAILLITDRIIRKLEFNQKLLDDDFFTCEVCEGKDGMGNYVISWSKRHITNKYPVTHPNSKFNSALIAHCEWCNCLHIRCPKCNSITALPDFQFDENIECNGGCDIIYHVSRINEHEFSGEYEIKIIDHRNEKCSKCGRDYIDDGGNTGICKKCEDEYINN